MTHETHCLSLDCPERTGGQCNVRERIAAKYTPANILDEFDTLAHALFETHKNTFWDGIEFGKEFIKELMNRQMHLPDCPDPNSHERCYRSAWTAEERPFKVK